MSLYSYSKFKIRITPDSESRQELSVGDLVRRQYADRTRTVYSLMTVLEVGEDTITAKDGTEQRSPYFIGALLEGDEPRDGELLDFVRISNLFDPDRSGALYLTASDSEAPFLDVIDGVGTSKALSYPRQDGYTCAGEHLLTCSYKAYEEGVSRIFRVTKNNAGNEDMNPMGIRIPLAKVPAHPARLVISYKIRSRTPCTALEVSLGIPGSDQDAVHAIETTSQWEYCLMVVTIDYPQNYARELLFDFKGALYDEGDWWEVAELNISELTALATLGDATKARVGKISGVADPLFGVLEGYGAYFQNLYATRNVNIAGTLTAGDENGFASTFYVGRIAKNRMLNSLRPRILTAFLPAALKPPTGVGTFYMLPVGENILECQSEAWTQTHAGEVFCFSFWVRSDMPHEVTVSCAGVELGKFEVPSGWVRHHVSFDVRHIAGSSLQLSLQGSQIRYFASPQLERGTSPTLYQPTDDTLSESEEYGAWFNRGGIGGTIQNPLLRLGNDGSISSANGSFVINADGSGHFAGGRFRWDKEQIELTDLTIDWSEIASHIPKPVSVRAAISSNQRLLQVFSWETNTTKPNWALSPHLVLTPSLFASTFGQEDQITAVASDGKPGIKAGSVTWYKENKAVISGQNSSTIAGVSGKYALTVKSNAIGLWSPQMTYAFTAIYVDANGTENPVRAELQFSLISAPSSSIMASITSPDGLVFRDGAPSTLRLHCDLWRGSKIEDQKVAYAWGVPDESVFANTQIAAACPVGVTQAMLRSTANLVPGSPIKIISTLYTITAVEHAAGTVSFTPATKGPLSVNAIVTCPNYNTLLGAGWITLTEANPRGTLSGWQSNELVLSPGAVAGNQTFKCAVRDDNDNRENQSFGKVVYDTASVSDVTVPDISALEWIEEWDTNKTHIGAELVVTPKIFAGVKHDDGLVTGVALGRFPLTMHNDSMTGTVVRTIDGIAGFDHGRKVFSVENSGNVQIGHGAQSISYKAATGRIEFGSGVSIAWTNAIATAKSEAIDSAAVIAHNEADAALGTAKTYAETKKTEAIESAATTAQSKADAALGTAKTYAETKKTEAIESAATTAQSKADAALGTAKTYADTKKTEAVTEAGKATDTKIGTLTSVLNVSIAEAKKAGEDARAVADAITTQATNGGWAGKLTYIDAHGIFTGTLSANTVNALRVNASQITAGTISTDRLDAATIKANIINAAYINGLNCTFAQGKIGGWTIGTSTLSADHIVLDSANKRLAVYGASSSQVSGQRVQLFYNSNADFGIYATDSSGVSIFQLGSVNKIAGWGITSTTIFKNNITLGADGSIANGARWKLGNDGAGRLASGNIAWDAAGNVTFGASVVLNWTNAATTAGANALNSAKTYADTKKAEALAAAASDATTKADAAKEVARAMAFGKMLYRIPEFFLNGAVHYNGTNNYLGNTTRSIEAVVGCPNSTGYALKYVVTDWSAATDLRAGGFLFANQSRANAVFVTRIIALIPAGWHIQNHHNSYGNGIGKWLTSNAGTGKWEEYIYKLTCGPSGTFSTVNHFALYGGSAPTAATPVVWYVAYATVFDVTASERYTTTIDANGIYTGTLTAAQVNAVAISAGSITTGTLSADRIAAGSINASKLDAASIKASIINTDYINGLSCSFVRGTIGGWTINGDSITAGSIGSIGQTPIQIRPNSSGSGYWYTGAYRPLGMAITWHQNSNAGHIVFGQVAATGNSPKVGFIGLQMMSWDNQEYFCLAANYSRAGSKEVYNRIAGWAFDATSISKNNVALGSDGSITNASRWRLNNDGSASFGSGKVAFNTDGSGRVANGKLNWDAAGNLTAEGGFFKDMTIQGTVRSAFVLNDPSIWVGSSDSTQQDPRHFDNVVVTQTGGWNEYINLPWTLDQSGRRICLVNYKWRSTISSGYMSITAPTGKYFYENGISQKTLSFSREVVELLGYGDNVTFFGWIVLNRRDMMCDGKYGIFQQVLAQGTVTCTSATSASIKYKTFDGSTMSVSKSGTGNFYVYMPWALGADKYMVMLTGRISTVQNTPIYGCIRNQYSSYFQVSTQDDPTQNDGSFNFQIISTADFN